MQDGRAQGLAGVTHAHNCCVWCMLCRMTCNLPQCHWTLGAPAGGPRIGLMYGRSHHKTYPAT